LAQIQRSADIGIRAHQLHRQLHRIDQAALGGVDRYRLEQLSVTARSKQRGIGT
jgi:hypothetical protein